jgi:effector-binding domain-containing protein
VLRIGEFSVLTQISIKTLRYYDEVGLLKPARVDLNSGYRYYSASQVPRLHRILALRDLGFPLDRIAVLKDLGPQWIVSMREVIPGFRTIGGLFGKLYGSLGPLASQGVAAAVFHDQEFKDQEVDVEVGVCLNHPVSVSEPLSVRELPRAIAASIVHHGAFNRISEAYQALLHWIDANGYRQAGPTRKLFLHVSQPTSRDDESNVTEIQVPVEKA